MSDLALKIRLTVDGGGEAKAEIVGLGAATAAMTADVTTAITALGAGLARIEAAVIGVGGQVRAAGDQVTAAIGGMAAATTQAADTTVAATTRQSDAWRSVVTAAGAAASSIEALRARYVPLAAAEQAHARAQDEITLAVRLGAIAQDQAAAASARASAALDEQRRALDPTEAAWRGLAAAVVAGAVATDQVRAKYLPLAAAEQAHAAALRDIQDAERLGILTKAEAAVAIERQAQALDRQRAALAGARSGLTGYAATGRLAAHEASNLAYQINDVVVSLAGGLSPAMVALQQGPQISQIFGGWGNAARALVGYLTPARLAIGGIASAVVGGALAYTGYLASTKAVEVAVTGLGRNSGVTVERLIEVAEASADAAGVSKSASVELATSFVSTGKIGEAQLGRLIEMSRDFGVTIGTDAAGGAERLAEMLADPVKGARTLFEQMGLLDGATADYVRTLAEQGRLTASQDALIAGLTGRLADAAQATSLLGRAWEGVYNWSSNAIRAIGEYVDDRASIALGEASPAVIRRELEGRIAANDREIGQYEREFPGQRGRLIEQLREENRGLRRQLEALPAAPADPASASSEAERRRRDEAATRAREAPVNSYARQLQDLQNQAAYYNNLPSGAPGEAPAATVAITRQQQALNDTLRETIAIGDPAAATLRAQQAAMEARTTAEKRAAAEALKRVELSTRVMTAEQREAEIRAAGDQAIAAGTQALGERAAALTASLAAADAYLISSAAGMRADAQREASIEAVTSGVNAAVMAQRLLAEQVAGTALAAAQQVAQIRDQAAAQAAVNGMVEAGTLTAADATRALQVEQALRPLIAAAAVAEGDAKEQLTRIITEMRGAMAGANDEAERAMALAGIDRQRQALELAEYELTLLGESTARREYLIALREKEIELQGRYGANWREVGASELRLYEQTLRTTAALTARTAQSDILTGAYRRAGEAIQDSLSTAFRKVLDGGENAFESFADDLKGLFWDLSAEIAAALVFRPIIGGVVNAAFGTEAAASLGLSTSSAMASAGGRGGSITDLMGLSNLLGGGAGGGWMAGINSYLFGTASTAPASVAATTGAAPGFLTGGGVTSAGNGTAGLFGTFGEIGLGSILGAGGAGFGISQFLSGLAPGNKLVSAGGGAAAGALSGLLITGGNPLGALVGGVAGLLGGMLNSKPSNMEGVNTIIDLSSNAPGVDQGQTGKKYSAENWAGARVASDAVRDAAQAAFGKYADLSAAGVSFGVGSRDGSRSYILENGEVRQEFRASSDEAGIKSLIGQSIAAIGRQYAESLPIEMQKALAKIDFSADIDEALRLLDFAAGYHDTIKALVGGYGLEDQARKAARDSIEQQVEALRVFKADAARLDLGDAAAAVREFGLTLVGLKEKKATVSEAEAALSALDESFKVFRENLGTLGLTLDDVNAGYTASLTKLRNDFNAALDRSITEGLGAGYLNDVEDLLTAQGQRIKDATALGADMGRIYRLNALEVRSKIKDLTADQLAAINTVAGAAESLALQVEIAFRGLSTAVDGQIKASSASATTARQSADAYREAARSLATARDGLARGDLSILSPQQVLTDLRGDFFSASAAAKGGDQSALSRLPQLAEAFLRASRDYNSDTDAYIGDYNLVQGQLAAATASSAGLASAAEYQAELIDAQTRVLESIRSNLADEAGVNELLLREQLAALAAIGGLIESTNALTIGQTSTTSARLVAAEQAIIAVRGQIAGGITITDAATINGRLATVQQALIGVESAEAASLRSTVAALQVVMQQGLLAVVAAGPTTAALDRAQAAISSTDTAGTAILAGLIDRLRAVA
ncbi:phage tail length tape measure family protein, partial [Zavarzinia compransoris]